MTAREVSETEHFGGAPNVCVREDPPSPRRGREKAGEVAGRCDSEWVALRWVAKGRGGSIRDHRKHPEMNGGGRHAYG